jgi:hypothetical protein
MIYLRCIFYDFILIEIDFEVGSILRQPLFFVKKFALVIIPSYLCEQYRRIIY